MTTIYLNESAAAIWRLCDGKRTVGEIVDLLKSVYPDLSHQLEGDVSGTIEQFADHHILDLTEPERGAGR